MSEKVDSDARKRGLPAVLLLGVLVALVHGACVRPGHTWWGMDDYTAYLVHGRNILEGLPYTDIDTVHDPGLPPSFQRTAFPPAFSLLVGLVDRSIRSGAEQHALAQAGDQPFDTDALHDDPRRRGGLDLVPLKRVLALIMGASVVAVFFAMRRTTHSVPLALGLLGFAASPYLFAFKELVRSEMAFVLLAYLWMGMVQYTERRERDGHRTYLLAVAAGLVMGLAYATRTAAVVLPPALITADLLRHRKLRMSSIISLGVAGALIFGQRAAFASVEGGYVGKAVQEWGTATLVENAQQLSWNAMRIWENGFSTVLQQALAVGFVLLMLIGLVDRLRKPTVVEVFVLGYMTMIFLLPTDSAWMRYLIPALPFALICAFSGARLLGRWMPGQAVPLWAASVLLFGTYASAYAHMDHGPLRDGLSAPETVEVFEWVEQHTGPDEVVIFQKWRTLSLATGRPSTSYPQIFRHGELPDDELWQHFRRIGAVAFVLKHTPPTESNLFRMLNHSDQGFLERFVAKYPEHFDEKLRNDEFVVYELRGYPPGT